MFTSWPLAPQHCHNSQLVIYFLLSEVIHHGDVGAQKVCVVPTGLKRAFELGSRKANVAVVADATSVSFTGCLPHFPPR